MFGPHIEADTVGQAQGLIPIGYWRSMDKRRTRDARPNPFDHVDAGWAIDFRPYLVAYLRAGETRHTWVGSSTCRLCGLRPNGNRDLTDGTYVWPEGLAHGVEEHGLRPPEAFVTHVTEVYKDVLQRRKP